MIKRPADADDSMGSSQKHYIEQKRPTHKHMLPSSAHFMAHSRKLVSLGSAGAEGPGARSFGNEGSSGDYQHAYICQNSLNHSLKLHLLHLT